MCLLAKLSAHADKGVKASRSSLFPPRTMKHTHEILPPGLDAKESDSRAREELAVRFTVGAEVAWNLCCGSCCPALGTFLVLVHLLNLLL